MNTNTPKLPVSAPLRSHHALDAIGRHSQIKDVNSVALPEVDLTWCWKPTSFGAGWARRRETNEAGLTMFATTIYLDKSIPIGQLAKAFAAATSIAPDQVVTMTRADFERSPRHWFNEEHRIGLQWWHERGDFPLAIEIVSRFNLDARTVLPYVAHDLGVAILTEPLDADLLDTGWRAIVPDGSSAIVFADADELDADDPAIILEPESRARYRALRGRELLTF